MRYLTLKARYYPDLDLTVSETPFGIQETNIPDLYERPLPDQHIVRFDLFAGLSKILGTDILFYRDRLYNVVAGKNGKEASYKELELFYNVFPAMKRYIQDACLYGDLDIPTGDLVISKIIKELNAYENVLMDKYSVQGIRFLIKTNCYLYFSPRIEIHPTEEGVKFIC